MRTLTDLDKHRMHMRRQQEANMTNLNRKGVLKLRDILANLEAEQLAQKSNMFITRGELELVFLTACRQLNSCFEDR